RRALLAHHLVVPAALSGGRDGHPHARLGVHQNITLGERLHAPSYRAEREGINPKAHGKFCARLGGEFRSLADFEPEFRRGLGSASLAIVCFTLRAPLLYLRLSAQLLQAQLSGDLPGISRLAQREGEG